MQPYYCFNSNTFVHFTLCNFKFVFSWFITDLLASILHSYQLTMIAQVLMEIVFESLSSFRSSVHATAHLLSKKSLELQSMSKFTIWRSLVFSLPPRLFGNYCSFLCAVRMQRLFEFTPSLQPVISNLYRRWSTT